MTTLLQFLAVAIVALTCWAWLVVKVVRRETKENPFGRRDGGY